MTTTSPATEPTGKQIAAAQFDPSRIVAVPRTTELSGREIARAQFDGSRELPTFTQLAQALTPSEIRARDFPEEGTTGLSIAVAQWRSYNQNSPFRAPSVSQTTARKAMSHWEEQKPAAAAPQPPQAAPAPRPTAKPATASARGLEHWTKPSSSAPAPARPAALSPAPAPAAPATFKPDDLDTLAAAMVLDPAAWSGTAKTREEYEAAATAILKKELPGLSSSAREEMAATVAAELASARRTRPEAGTGSTSKADGESWFADLVASGKWTPPHIRKLRESAAKSSTPAAAVPTPAVPTPAVMGEILELEKMRAANRLAGGIAAAVHAGAGLPKPGLLAGIRGRIASMFGF